MIKNLAVLALILSVTGCKDERPEHTQRAEDRGKIEITKDFFDPASVQFRNLKTEIKLSSYRVCGELNARNKYGAYVGFKRFVASLTITSDLRYVGGSVEGQTGFSSEWTSYCQ